MKNILKISIVLLTLISSNLHATASELKSNVKWNDYKEFRDLESDYSTDKKHFKHFKKEMEYEIERLSKKYLKNDYKIEITIKDVDQAGELRFIRSDRIRVIKDIYSPRIKISYKIFHNNLIIKKEDAEIRDMNFLTINHMKSSAFEYEKRAMEKWFKKTF